MAGTLLRQQAVLLLALDRQRPAQRALRQCGAGIGDDEPGLAVVIGAHPDAMPLERIGDQGRRAAHERDSDGTGAAA